ncbi:MAG: chemotaxis protein CheB [Planctomycetes bacterium]|nr:chemotaxis protein CheB [Planctomycetota bacterium]
MRAVRPCFVVGIGGSAGGLAAYLALFDAMPCDTGMAFVIISHILPSSAHSLLADILLHHTKMTVQVAAAAMPILPDHVYVIPANTDLRMQDDAFNLDSPRTMNKQVDIFLTSLAAAMGPRAIAVIVSGYDGDGAEGCRHIKAKGGTTFAQDSTATVGEMPQSARATGCIDFVLPAAKIAQRLQGMSAVSS